MLEREHFACKRLPREARQRRARARRQMRFARAEARAIKRIAQERMPDMGEMHADLVRAPRFQPAGDKAGYSLRLAPLSSIT